jgi:lantibiotic modifying enzyme
MSQPQFLEVADSIGRLLCRDALWSGNECNWLGWGMHPDAGAWRLASKAQPATLYDGTAGIGLFLARLFQFTGDARLKSTIAGAINRSIAGAAEITAAARQSLYGGTVGIALVCMEVGRVMGSQKLIDWGLGQLTSLRGEKPDAAMLDLVGGTAGTVQALSYATRRFGRSDLTETAHAFATALASQAEKSGDGVSWNTMPGQSSHNLLGYAHGAAGIGCALFEIGSLADDAGLIGTAREAFRYERAHFHEAHSNWPDYRLMEPGSPPPAEPSFMMAWCHGAPGIGLSRLRAWELKPGDEPLGRDLERSLQATVNSFATPLVPGQSNFCLCHGAAGNAELLIESAEVLGRPEYQEAARTVGLNGINVFHEQGLPWPCGVMGGGETPNLMLGLAGIGYFYLRLHDAARAPSVLLLRAGPPLAD